ncbi:MAG: hypothetical protein K8T20_05365 [Planctomycetes bacterium]|nr:hypothetical protein [Planctomycetota bacterium]
MPSALVLSRASCRFVEIANTRSWSSAIFFFRALALPVADVFVVGLKRVDGLVLERTGLERQGRGHVLQLRDEVLLHVRRLAGHAEVSGSARVLDPAEVPAARFRATTKGDFAGNRILGPLPVLRLAFRRSQAGRPKVQVGDDRRSARLAVDRRVHADEVRELVALLAQRHQLVHRFLPILPRRFHGEFQAFLLVHHRVVAEVPPDAAPHKHEGAEDDCDQAA